MLKSEGDEERKEGYDRKTINTKEKPDESLEQISPFSKFQRKSRNLNVGKNQTEKENTNKTVS